MEPIKTERISILPAVTASSFEQIFKEYFKALYHYACTLIKNEANAEEIVQQVFVRLWEKRTELSFDVSVKAYLYKSVYHHCLNYLKHQQVKSSHVKYVETQPLAFEENASGKILSKELQAHIQAALNDLPGQCGKIFQMSRLEGLKYHEIAQHTNLSVKTIEAQMGKALRLMRARLAEYLPMIIVMYIIT